jgi:hypothetical protein
MIITTGVQNRDFCYLDFLLDFLVTYILLVFNSFPFKLQRDICIV